MAVVVIYIKANPCLLIHIVCMRKQIVTAITIGSIALSTVTATSALAATGSETTSTALVLQQMTREERQNARITEFAHILNISVEEIKTELKAGKKPLQIAKAHGLTEDQLKQKFADYRAAQLKVITNELAAEVASGTITQAQMDARLKAITKHAQKHQGWHRRHFGFAG